MVTSSRMQFKVLVQLLTVFDKLIKFDKSLLGAQRTGGSL